MNVLILISSLKIGGAEKQAVSDANLLSKKLNVHLVAFSDGLLSEQLSNDVTKKIIKKKNYFYTIFMLTKYIRDKKISLIHASLFSPMVISSICSFFSKITVFWSFHSHNYDLPLKSKFALRLLSKFNRLKKIFFVNKELREFYFQNFGFSKEKCEVLYNSTNLKKHFESNNSSIINISYVGRLIELKRVNYIIETAFFLINNNIENFKINIYGDGPEKKKLEQMSFKLELSDKILFHGFTLNLKSAYKNTDIFINPSQEECLSIALIDAGISAIPSVAFNVGGNDEIIINNKTGFIVSDKVSLFHKTLELISDKNKRILFGENANVHCEKFFNEKNRLQNLLNYFNA